MGAVRTAGTYRKPTLGANALASQTFFMGQGLLQPPTVEGWHEGVEWIDSGALVERINFCAKEVSNVNNPGVRNIIDRLASESDGELTPEELVDRCIDLIGPFEVAPKTRYAIVEFASREGNLDIKDHQKGDESEQRVGHVLRLLASTKEYQLA